MPPDPNFQYFERTLAFTTYVPFPLSGIKANEAGAAEELLSIVTVCP